MRTLFTSSCRTLRVSQIQASASNDDESWSDLAMYREYTIAILRRYFRMSIDLGKVPSILGSEFFRAKVSSYKMHTFEDVVVYVHDIERCLERLDAGSRWMIARVVFQEYSHDEVADLLSMSRRQIVRRYAVSLDRLTEILLQRELLLPLDSLQRGRTVRSVLNERVGGIFGREKENAGSSKKPVQSVQRLDEGAEFRCQAVRKRSTHICATCRRKGSEGGCGKSLSRGL
jgi:hypothetical protein